MKGVGNFGGQLQLSKIQKGHYKFDGSLSRISLVSPNVNLLQKEKKKWVFYCVKTNRTF